MRVTLPRLDARRAGVDASWGAVDERAHPLDVRVPAPVVPLVREGHGLAEERLLPADVADGCHSPTRLPDAAHVGDAPATLRLRGQAARRGRARDSSSPSTLPRPGSPVGVEEHRDRQARSRSRSVRIAPSGSNSDGNGTSILGDERLGALARVERVDAEELHVGMLGRGLGEHRHLALAGLAPRRPEVHDDRGASQLAEQRAEGLRIGDRQLRDGVGETRRRRPRPRARATDDAGPDPATSSPSHAARARQATHDERGDRRRPADIVPS